MAIARRAVELARTLRGSAGIRTRQPLARLWLALPGRRRSPDRDALLALIRDEVNVRAVELIGDESALVERRVKPLLPKIGKKLGSAIPAIMAAARENAVEYHADGSVTLGGVTLAAGRGRDPGHAATGHGGRPRRGPRRRHRHRADRRAPRRGRRPRAPAGDPGPPQGGRPRARRPDRAVGRRPARRRRARTSTRSPRRRWPTRSIAARAGRRRRDAGSVELGAARRIALAGSGGSVVTDDSRPASRTDARRRRVASRTPPADALAALRRPGRRGRRRRPARRRRS